MYPITHSYTQWHHISLWFFRKVKPRSIKPLISQKRCICHFNCIVTPALKIVTTYKTFEKTWFLTRLLTTLKTSAHRWKGLKFKIRVNCSRKPAWGRRDSETCLGLFLCSPSQNPSWWITCSPRPNASRASFVLLLKRLLCWRIPHILPFFPFLFFFFSFSKQGFWRHLLLAEGILYLQPILWLRI